MLLNGFTDGQVWYPSLCQMGKYIYDQVEGFECPWFPWYHPRAVGKFVQERRSQKVELIRVTLQGQECKILQEQHYQQEPLSSPPFIDNSLLCL